MHKQTKKARKSNSNCLHCSLLGKTYFLLAGLTLTIALAFLAFTSFAGISGQYLGAFSLNVGGTSGGTGFGVSISPSGGIGINIGSNGNSASGVPGGCTGSCLTPPAPDSYGGGIAANTSVKSAILTWMDFFLGFFALIAVVALVYAGFQYVTAGGEDEQVGKAKKGVIFVMIGIIVVLGAWVLVNSLITYGPSGGEPVRADLLNLDK
jgi:hypothetical protein